MTSLLDALLSQSTGASLPQPSSRRAPGQLASGLWAHGLWSQERRQEQGSLPPPAHAVHRSGQLGVTHGCSLSPGTRWGGSSPSPADWFWLGGGSLRGACCLEVFSWPWSCSLASQMWTRSRPLSAESAGARGGGPVGPACHHRLSPPPLPGLLPPPGSRTLGWVRVALCRGPGLGVLSAECPWRRPRRFSGRGPAAGVGNAL